MNDDNVHPRAKYFSLQARCNIKYVRNIEKYLEVTKISNRFALKELKLYTA